MPRTGSLAMPCLLMPRGSQSLFRPHGSAVRHWYRRVVRPDDVCSGGHWWSGDPGCGITAEFLERRQLRQRVRSVRGVRRRYVHERDPVVEAHDLVLDVARLLGMQLREHRLDQAYMLGDGLGPDLVTDDYAADHATLSFGLGLTLARSGT